MISVQIFQTSAGTAAKSHTCATDAARGRLLGYLLLLGTQEAAVKVTPIPGPPDAFRGGGRRSRLRFRCSCVSSMEIMNMERSLFTGTSSAPAPFLESSLYVVFCFFRVLINTSIIRSLSTDIWSSGFHTKSVSISRRGS